MNRVLEVAEERRTPDSLKVGRHLWDLRLLGVAGILFATIYFDGWSRPLGTAFLFGLLALLMVARELRKLWDRVEHLESTCQHSSALGEQPLRSASSE